LDILTPPEEASVAYLRAKATYVEELLIEFPQPSRLMAAVRCKMAKLIENETQTLQSHIMLD